MRRPSYSEADLQVQAKKKIPRHIAIIMDGNGRWAENHGLPRFKGHEKGAKTVKQVTEECSRIGVEFLTLYALSTENMLKRPPHEKKFLLELLKLYLKRETRTFMSNKIVFRTIGRTWEFPEDVRREITKLEKATSGNTGMVLCLALNYSGRAELTDAMNNILAADRAGSLEKKPVSEESLREFLYAPDIPDPDLLIRTAGELRVSNFLLWQVSYTELHCTEVLWPDFGTADLAKAMDDFAGRTRKFGGLK